MNSVMPTKLTELIKRLDKALAGSPNPDELFQIENIVGELIEYLNLVATPVSGSDKPSGLSTERPTYRISREAAMKANTAQRDAKAMKSAVKRQDWQNALASAHKIQMTMP